MAVRQFGSTIDAGMVLRLQHWFGNAQRNQLGIISMDYYVNTKGIGVVTMGDVLDNEASDLDDGIRTWLNSGALLLGHKLFQVTNPPQPLPGIYDSNLAGLGPTTQITSQMAIMLTKRTLLSGPKYRGRVFLPFADSQYLDGNGELLAAFIQTDVAPLIGTWKDFGVGTYAGVDLNCSPILYNRVGHFHTNVIDIVCVGRLGAQRKRGDFGTPNAIALV